MDSQLNDVAYLIQFKDCSNIKVSEKPISWHLDHTLKVINNMYNVLKNSDTAISTKHFNLLRRFLFNIEYIPRGKGQSPTSVLPPKEIRTENLLSQLELSRENLREIKKLDPNVNLIHPIFGQLNKKQTIRFLRIHTKHHLKIISDILAKK